MEQLILKCKYLITSSPDHEMPLGARNLIWGELGGKAPRIQKKIIKKDWAILCNLPEYVCAGHFRRFLLAKWCAEKTLPYWNVVFPSSNVDEIIEILSFAQDVINGRFQVEDAAYQYREYFNLANERLYDSKYAGKSLGINVMFNAVRVANIAIFDEEYDPTISGILLPNDELYPDIYDAAYDACGVYAYAFTPNTKDLVSLRRIDFWTWWLDQAEKIWGMSIAQVKAACSEKSKVGEAI